MIQIVADPWNPVDFLAVCGLAEWMSLHELPLPYWKGQECVVIDGVGEKDLLNVLLPLGDAELTFDDAYFLRGGTDKPFLLTASGHSIRQAWMLSDGSLTVWKGYSGPRKAKAVIEERRDGCRVTSEGLTAAGLLIVESIGKTIGWDPMSKPVAANFGRVLNDMKDEDEKTVQIRCWAELLASIAISRWPFIGSRKDGFKYALWHAPDEIELVRARAAGAFGLQFFAEARRKGTYEHWLSHARFIGQPAS